MSDASEKAPSTAASVPSSAESTVQPPATGVYAQSGPKTLTLDDLMKLYIDPKTGDVNSEFGDRQ